VFDILLIEEENDDYQQNKGQPKEAAQGSFFSSHISLIIG
jgi:hypothetical protein